jgi:hypothetical protein
VWLTRSDPANGDDPRLFPPEVSLLAEPPPSAARTWSFVLAVVCVWIFGGLYVWRSPLPSIAEASVQVPPGTDLETLCAHPEVVQAALDKLRGIQPKSTYDAKNTLDAENSPTALSGTLSVRKIADGSWKLTYQAVDAETAVRELRALVGELERHLAAPKNEKLALERRGLESQLAQLKLKQVEIQSGSQADESERLDNESIIDLGANDGLDRAAVTAGSGESVGLKERISTLQRAATEARVERLRTEEDLALVESGLATGKRLQAIANQMTAGPVQEAVRHVDKQARLSNDLKQINATLSKDSEIYGDNHPRLVELRRRFERMLQEVGGWENLLVEASVRDHLMVSLEQILESRRERESDLQIQIELEQSALQDRARVELARSRDASILKKLGAEIAATQRTLDESNKPPAGNFATIQVPAVNSSLTLLEHGWPWGAVLIGGLAAGWCVTRIPPRERQPEYDHSVQLPLLTVPRVLLPQFASVTTPSVAEVGISDDQPLDLAERRAARRSRWQQTYA